MKQFLLLVLCCYFTYAAQAQVHLSGTVQDKENEKISGATAVLLATKDSTLQHFMITEATGNFEFQKVEYGDYILQISFLGYETHNENILVEGKNLVYEIVLKEEAKLLNTVTVEAERIPIRMKGDTIEYNADAFKTKSNSVVEDLLKKLPGVEVDRNGQIKAQGKEVTKVLVDGKEFFGNDATIATRNLPADAIDKVEVFDKKSDMAEFSGVDDGARDKTINLKLKEDKKQGYFGTVKAGYGTNNRYEAKGNINRFAPNLQLSAIGRSNNINEQGFSIQDYMDFMGGLGGLMSGSAMINPEDLGISFNQDGRKEGFVQTHAGGLNMNYDFSKKTDFHLNYFYNQIKKEEERHLFRQNLLGEQAAFETQQTSDQIRENYNHRVNTELKHEIDSTQDLKLRTDFLWNDNALTSHSFSETFNADKALENTSLSNYLSDGRRINFKSNLTYRKRLGKLGRTFVGKAGIGKVAALKENQVAAVNMFTTFQDSLEQEQIRDNDQLHYNVELSYTEPLGKKKYLQVSYQRQDFSDELSKEFYDISQAQAVFNTTLSNYFTKDYLYDRAGLSFQYNKKKSKLSLGLDTQRANLQGKLQSENAPIERTFSNLLPNLRWQYDFNTFTNFSVSYDSNIEAPSLEQLQPIVDNSNPLNIYIGNPDLAAEYQHNLSTNFSLFDQFSFTNLFAYANVRYTEHKISETRSVDSLLRQTVRPINVENDVFVYGNINFGTALRPIKTKININHDFQFNRAILYVNEVENRVNRWSGKVSLSLENRKKKVVDAIIGTRLGFNKTAYSINTNQNQAFLNQSYFVDGSVDIGEKWNVSTLFEHTIYTADTFNPKEAISLWQASVSHYIGEAQRWEVKISAFDLLNQNIGINRNSSANFIQTEQIRSLGRYFMLSFAYSIKGFGKKE